MTTDLPVSPADLPVSDEDLAALHRRLETSAREQGLVDLVYRSVDSPVGALLVAATDAGVVRVAFELEGFDAVLDALSAKVGARVLRSPARLDAVAVQLEEYFAGRRTSFDVPLDLRLSSGFRALVQQYLPRIPFGHTASYAEVAQVVGHPKAVRAVGSACATNPLPVIVPCHRVLRGDGSLGGYLGGLEAKRTLLHLEGAA